MLPTDGEAGEEVCCLISIITVLASCMNDNIQLQYNRSDPRGIPGSN